MKDPYSIGSKHHETVARLLISFQIVPHAGGKVRFRQFLRCESQSVSESAGQVLQSIVRQIVFNHVVASEIGRASCRERV